MPANAETGVQSVREEWVTVPRAAARLGVSVPVVIKLICRGELSCRRVGTWRRVSVAEIEALDRKSTVPATAR